MLKSNKKFILLILFFCLPGLLTGCSAKKKSPEITELAEEIPSSEEKNENKEESKENTTEEKETENENSYEPLDSKKDEVDTYGWKKYLSTDSKVSLYAGGNFTSIDNPSEAGCTLFLMDKTRNVSLMLFDFSKDDKPGYKTLADAEKEQRNDAAEKFGSDNLSSTKSFKAGEYEALQFTAEEDTENGDKYRVWTCALIKHGESYAVFLAHCPYEYFEEYKPEIDRIFDGVEFK